MTDVDAYRRAFSRLPRGAREAEVNEEERRLSLVELRDGEVTGVDQSEGSALYVRVSGERTGYLFTQDQGDDPAEVLAAAYENGGCSERPFPDEMRRGPRALARDYGHGEAESDLRRLGEGAAEFARALRESAPGSADLFVSLRSETLGMRTVNSHGLDTGFTRPLYIMSATAISERGGRRYSAAYNATAASRDAFRAGEFGENLSELLESQYDPEPFRSGSYRAVLRNNVVYNILSTAWQLFSAKRCLEGSSLLAGKLGDTVAAPCLSLADYPSRPDSGFDLPCDCEGSPGIRARLLERGVLGGLMHNLATATALGVEPTGNAGRRPLLSGNIPTEIQVCPRNVCIEPGARSLGELVARMDEGVLVTGSFDVFHSINIASGAFSIPCKGVVVRAGRRRAPTGPLVLSGNLKGLFEGIEEVGSDFYLGTMLALDNYGIGTCSLRVGELSFSGA